MAAPGLSRDEIDRLWICKNCTKRYVVPSLARDCEDRHLAATRRESNPLTEEP